MSANPSQTTPAGSLTLITGATGGLGKALAVECASRGWDLYLTDLSAGALDTLAGALRSAYGVRVFAAPCDLTDPTARANLVEELRAQHYRLRSLINVAGVDFEGPFLGLTSAQVQTILRVNIEATLELTHAVLSLRDPLTAFHIINVASLAAYTPMPVKATYAASKRFLLDFSLALREELRELGVTVTALCPAGMPTNWECIQGIQAQGLMGLITTQDVGRVAAQTLDAALAGRAIVIPGLANRVLQTLSGLVPAGLTARLVGQRWKTAHQKWAGQAALNPAE